MREEKNKNPSVEWMEFKVAYLTEINYDNSKFTLLPTGNLPPP